MRIALEDSVFLENELFRARREGDAAEVEGLHALEHLLEVQASGQPQSVVAAAMRRLQRALEAYHPSGAAAKSPPIPALVAPAPARSYAPSGKVRLDVTAPALQRSWPPGAIRLDDGSPEAQTAVRDAAYAEAIRLDAQRLNRENYRGVQLAAAPDFGHTDVLGHPHTHQATGERHAHPHAHAPGDSSHDTHLAPPDVVHTQPSAKWGSAGPPVRPRPDVQPKPYPTDQSLGAWPGFQPGSACPNCGQRQAGGERFCSTCGQMAPGAEDVTAAAGRSHGALLNRQSR